MKIDNLNSFPMTDSLSPECPPQNGRSILKFSVREKNMVTGHFLVS